MILQKISIVNYKNIEQETLDFSPHINCFVGKNGQGKTNILDAVYYLSFCKSSTNPNDMHNIRHGEEYFLLQGEYRNDLDAVEKVSCSLKQGKRKSLKRNGKDLRKLSEHIGTIPIVMVCPSDQAFVEGGSEERRRLYDTIISQYDLRYLESLMRYNKTLQQRNSLLKQDEGFDLGVMEVLEDMMSEDADYIYKARQKFTQEISPIVSDIYKKLCNTNDENIVIGYESHCDRGCLKTQLVGWREKEKIVGYTLHGIHKDDMIFELNGYSVRREGSQGQTKTFCIAVKLAQYLLLRGKGEMKVPILLLDDIFDKLDHGRVERIIEYVSENDFGQIFITDTDYVRLNKILEQTPYSDYRFFEVTKGKTTTNIILSHEA